MSLSEEELDALMAALSTGHREAFTPLFRELLPRAQRFARARLPVSAAEDAAQNALLKVFARASEFIPGKPVLPWFYAVLGNEIRAVVRKEGKAFVEVSEDLRVDLPDAEAGLLRDELERALERAVADLDPVSAEAIAAALGRAERPQVPDSTFRKRLSRAYERLRATFRGGELEH